MFILQPQKKARAQPMRTTRITESTPELDKLENEWWNSNAELIEQVWAQSYEIQKAIRLPYLKKAKKFLQNNQDQSLIWEVGCGTGWVCRMIADEHFHVIGTDFSESQIRIANESAKAFGKEAYCKYLLTDANTRIEGHSGILISAILHHLSKVELEGFFKLIEDQKKGVRVFLFEPVFIEAKNNNGAWIALLIKQLPKIYRSLVGALIKLSGKKNVKLINDVNGLFVQAEKNNWFLSPKEVPLYESELNEYLNRYFTIHDSYFVNKSELEIAQNLMYYNMQKPGWMYTNVLIPFSIFLDRIFFSFNFRAVTKGQYFFKCYELIVK